MSVLTIKNTRKKARIKIRAFLLAERKGFEPPMPQRSITDFESAAFNHSAISPIDFFLYYHIKKNQEIYKKILPIQNKNREYKIITKLSLIVHKVIRHSYGILTRISNKRTNTKYPKTKPGYHLLRSIKLQCTYKRNNG